MSNLNYQSSESNLLPDSTQSSSVGVWLAIIGSLLLLSLPIGFISTITFMFQAFQDITTQGTGDPKLMAGGISSALVSIIVGLVVALPGAILLCVSIVFFEYRRPWVFFVSFIGALITLFMFPIGTIISIIILIMLFRKKSSFFTCAKIRHLKSL